MTRVLVICDERSHAHDYGTDYLIQGLYALLGEGHVLEWPEKPNLHLKPGERRDACQIDSDAWLPSSGYDRTQVAALVEGSWADVVILTNAEGTAGPWREVCGGLRSGVPVVGLSFADAQASRRADLEAITGMPLALYAQRERPPDSAFSLWLSQPQCRVRRIGDKPTHWPHIYYRGSNHGWGREGPRVAMVKSILANVPADQCVLQLDESQEGHLSPEEYREHLWQASVSAVWNSWREHDWDVWDSNRLWESLALGCAVVAERPPVAWPHGALPGVTWVDTPEAVGPAVRELLEEPEQARALASVSQTAFVQHYTSERLAEQLLKEAGR